MNEENKIRNDLFAKYREEVLRRELSNTENYDKAVLSLGTTFLGFSMVFLKDFVSYKDAIYAPLLPISWALFCLSIVATIASFVVSQKGLSIQLKYAEKYYLENDESYLTKKNPASIWTNRVNYISAFSFTLAIITTIIFVIINLTNSSNMSEKKSIVIAQDAASVPSMQRLVKGTDTPTFQQLPNGIGVATTNAQIPKMQLSPAAPELVKSATAPQFGDGSTNRRHK